MRIVYLINSLGAGGAEQSFVELLPLLRDSGIEVTVATLSGQGVCPPDGARARVEAVQLESRGRARQVGSTIALLRRSRADLVHTSLFDADVIGRIAGRVARVPVLTSLVNTMYDPVRLGDPAIDARKLRIVKAVDSWTGRHWTDHFHAITHAVARSCVETMRLDPSRITVIERGRDAARLGEPSTERRRIARQALGLDDGDEVVLTVGRQEWQKAHTDLVAAFDDLAASNPRAQLLIAGRSGHASSALQASVRAASHSDRIRVLGHRDDVGDLLSAADVFAFPSRYEGLGGSVIEAMAMGLPVVASQIPALQEVVEEGASARLVPVGSIGSLAGTMRELLADRDLCRQMGERGKQIFAERFTLSRSASRMVSLYEQVGRQ